MTMTDGSTRRMNAAELRAAIFQRKRTIAPLDISLPGLEELDGQLAVVELSAKDTVAAEKLAQTGEDEKDESLMLGAIVARGLVSLDTKERIFSDTDIGGIADFGFTVLKPLSEKIQVVSGMAPDALTKKNANSTPAPTPTSPTSSPANSEAGTQPTNS